MYESTRRRIISNPASVDNESLVAIADPSFILNQNSYNSGSETKSASSIGNIPPSTIQTSHNFATKPASIIVSAEIESDTEPNVFSLGASGSLHSGKRSSVKLKDKHLVSSSATVQGTALGSSNDPAYPRTAPITGTERGEHSPIFTSNSNPVQYTSHIKHSSARSNSKKDFKTEIYLTPSTPIIAALKHVTKVIEDVPKNAPKAKYVSVRGLGKAIDRAVIVAVRLQQQGHTVSFHSGTVTVVDEYESNQDPTSSAYLQSRKVKSMEIRVHIS